MILAVEKEPEKNSSLTKNQTLYLQWLDAMLYSLSLSS